MIQAKCIEKFRDKNKHIYGYRLQDINGQTQDVRPDNLKQAIRSNQIHVVNLTLTSDNRLVDTNEKQLQSKSLGKEPQPPKSEVKWEEIFNKTISIITTSLGCTDYEECDNSQEGNIATWYSIPDLEYKGNPCAVEITLYDKRYTDKDNDEFWLNLETEDGENIYELKARSTDKDDIKECIKAFLKEVKKLTS